MLAPPTVRPLPIPPKVKRDAHEPLVALLGETLISAKILSERWGYSTNHLSNLRQRNHGIPWIKLPTGPRSGGIRYRLSEIVAAEVAGTCGPISLERVALLIAACPEITDDQKTAVIARLRKALG